MGGCAGGIEGSEAVFKRHEGEQNGKRVWDGSQVEIGHNYVSVSRREFNLLRASGIDYAPPTPELVSQHRNES